MGANKNSKWDGCDIYQRYDNDLIGNFSEKQLKEQSISSLCSINTCEPLVFNIEYIEQSIDKLSDI